MAAANLDAADLKADLSAPGLINEDVVQTVYNLDEGIPTPIYNALAGGSFSNNYAEWPQDDLEEPDTDNAVVDGADAQGNDAKPGLRLGNHAQLSDKVIRLSDLSESLDSVGNIGTMAYQTARRMMALRRDIEAITCGRQASVPDNGTNTAGRTAGLGAWISTNVDTSGSVGGFNFSTKVVDAPTAGDPRPLAWEMIRDVIEGIYTAGGNPSLCASVPKVIKGINSFLFSTEGKPYRAAPTANVGGTSAASQTAQGYISVVLSDFGIELSFVANRLQQLYGGAADVFILDPQYAQVASLEGFRIKELAVTGHSENRLIKNTWMTKVFREDAHGLVADIDPAEPVTAEPVEPEEPGPTAR